MADLPEEKDNRGNNVTRLRPLRPCPVCKKPSAQPTFPFCSNRCADIDLNRWLNGAYVVATSDDNEENELPDKPV